jgi:hypothetical protein
MELQGVALSCWLADTVGLRCCALDQVFMSTCQNVSLSVLLTEGHVAGAQKYGDMQSVLELTTERCRMLR